MKIIFNKNQYIKAIKKVKQDIENSLTVEDCQKIINKKTLGADGISIALTILWLKEDIHELQPRNRRSRNKLIKWLKSEMRSYADYGSYNSLLCPIVDKYYESLKYKKEVNSK